MDRTNQINEKLYQANIDLVDKNRYLQIENERLKNIIYELEEYINKMSFASVVDNPKKDLTKILLKRVDNE